MLNICIIIGQRSSDDSLQYLDIFFTYTHRVHPNMGWNAFVHHRFPNFHTQFHHCFAMFGHEREGIKTTGRFSAPTAKFLSSI
jgi:hypothetical protein